MRLLTSAPPASRPGPATMTPLRLVLALSLLATAAFSRSIPYSASNIDFGDCIELTLGHIVPLARLQARVPAPVKVLPLSAQKVFPQRPGADKLGVLILRANSCDFITATLANGRTVTDRNKRFAHVGTAVNTSLFPPSPFSKDGDNAADFNNYAFGYYTDSWAYLSAMSGSFPGSWAQIDWVDTPVSNTTIDRRVSVYPRGPQRTARAYGYSASGRIPDVRKNPTVVPFVANWWDVTDGVVGVLSDNIAGQAASFRNLTDPAQAITITPTCNSQVGDLLDGDSVTADGIVLIGFIPETNGTDMVATPAGPVEGGCI